MSMKKKLKDPRARDLANHLARELFKCGDQTNSPTRRIQFMGGMFYDNSERGQGGFCEEALAEFFAQKLDVYLTLGKGTEQP
jgi:hypothetical protein